MSEVAHSCLSCPRRLPRETGWKGGNRVRARRSASRVRSCGPRCLGPPALVLAGECAASGGAVRGAVGGSARCEGQASGPRTGLPSAVGDGLHRGSAHLARVCRQPHPPWAGQASVCCQGQDPPVPLTRLWEGVLTAGNQTAAPWVVGSSSSSGRRSCLRWVQVRLPPGCSLHTWAFCPPAAMTCPSPGQVPFSSVYASACVQIRL